MKRLCKFCQKYKTDFFVIIVFFFYILEKILIKELGNLDEVWVFNTARNIANGLLPYKDFNLVTTPGLPIICGIVLRIFGTELFYMRIMAVILCTGIMYMIYKNLFVLEVNNEVTFLALFGIAYLFNEYFCIDYNFVILLIGLICLYLELRNVKTNELLFYNKKYDLIIGIFSGIAITMKQTAGLFFAFCVIGYKVLSVRNKKDFIEFFKIALTRAIGMLVPVLLLIVYLLVNGIFKDFVNYAILGVKEFTNNIPYKRLFDIDFEECWFIANYKGISIAILSIIAPVITAILLIGGSIKKNKTMITLSAFALSTFIMVYPIADNIHFLISATIAIINIIYILNIFLKKIDAEKLNMRWAIFANAFIDSVIIVNGTMIVLCSYVNLHDSNFYSYNLFKNYTNIPISDGIYSCIVDVDEYIKTTDGKVYIADARAPIFMIPLNRYNKNFDMLLIGNIGKDGSKNVINELENSSDDLKILIAKDEVGFNWQTPMDVINYIKTNHIKTGGVGMFDIYEKARD